MENLDLNKDQHLMSIRPPDGRVAHIEIKDGKIVTEGFVGEKTYENFVELIRGLWGFNIHMDNFYF